MEPSSYGTQTASSAAGETGEKQLQQPFDLTSSQQSQTDIENVAYNNSLLAPAGCRSTIVANNDSEASDDDQPPPLEARTDSTGTVAEIVMQRMLASAFSIPNTGRFDGKSESSSSASPELRESDSPPPLEMSDGLRTKKSKKVQRNRKTNEMSVKLTNNDLPPPLEIGTLSNASKPGSLSSSRKSLKKEAAATSDARKRKLPTSGGSSTVVSGNAKKTACTNLSVDAPSHDIITADDMDEETSIERIVRNQLSSMVDAIAGEVDDDDDHEIHMSDYLTGSEKRPEDDDDDDDDEWGDLIDDSGDYTTDEEDDNDDDESVDFRDIMFHASAIDTDSSESHASSDESTAVAETEPAVNNQASAEASEPTVIAAAVADSDEPPALENASEVAAAAAEAARTASRDGRREARVAARRERHARREAETTPPDSDYEHIEQLDVCHPVPAERYANLNYKLYAKESSLFQRRSRSTFSNSVYGSLFSAHKLELMRKLGGGEGAAIKGIGRGHEGCVNACDFSNDGVLLVSGSDDLNICVWDWAQSDSPRSKFQSGHRQNVFQTKFLPYSNNSVVITCARDGQVRLAELTDGGSKGTRLLGTHDDSAHKLAMRHDSASQFYSCGEDGYVKRYDLRESQPCQNVLRVRKARERRNGSASSSHEADVTLYAIDCNPLNNNEFVVCGVDDAVRQYDLRYVRAEEAVPVKTFCPAKFKTRKMKHISASCVVYDWNGSSLLVSYNDHNIFEFSNRGSVNNKTNIAAGGEAESSVELVASPKHVFRGHRNRATVKGVNYFGPNSEFVVSGSDCGHVFVWHRAAERVVNMMMADDQGVVNVLESHPTAPVLATSGLDHDIKIWVPSNESPGDHTADINKQARKNIRSRKNNEKRPAMPSGFMMALLNHLNNQRERNSDGNNDEDANGSQQAQEVAAASASVRLRRRRGDRRPAAENDGEDGADNDNDDDDDDAGDSRPIRCGVS